MQLGPILPDVASDSTNGAGPAPLACRGCGGRELEGLRVQRGVPIRARGVDAHFDVHTALCSRCGLVQTAPQPDEALLGLFYAGQFRDLFAGDGRVPGEGSRRDQARWLEAQLGSLRGARALEIGCYDGFLLTLLREGGARVQGIEPCAEAARFGRERYGLEIRAGRLEDAELEPGRYDLVLLSHVLEHLRDPLDALRRARAALRPGGSLFVEVPNVLAPRAEHVVDFFTFDHLFNFSPRTLARLAARCGFASTAVDTDFPFPAFRGLSTAAAVPAEPFGAPESSDPVAVDECRRAVRAYALRHDRFVAELRERVAGWVEAWRARGTRVALYGGGSHTDHLFQHTDLARAPLVAVVDGNPARRGERYRGLPVHAPEALSGLEVGAILISSYDFQDEMVETVKRVCAAPPEIRTLYPRIEAFSSYPGRAAAAPEGAVPPVGPRP